MEWSPGASFPPFSAVRKGVARRRNALVLFPSPPQWAILRSSTDSPFVSAVLFPCPVASGGPLSLRAPRKRRKKCARGNLFRGGSLWTPSPTTKGLRPIGSPAGVTGDEGREFPSSVTFGDSCLAAARSRRGSDLPPAGHSLPRRRFATPGEARAYNRYPVPLNRYVSLVLRPRRGPISHRGEMGERRWYCIGRPSLGSLQIGKRLVSECVNENALPGRRRRSGRAFPPGSQPSTTRRTL